MAILDENGQELSPLDEMMGYGNGGTVLDRLADGYEGLHPAEFRLRGMSEAGQRLFASDVAKRIARKAKRKSVDIDPDILEQKIMNMPEDRYRASFMGLPDDKRAYYENANPGDPLFIRDPSIPDSRAFFVKGDPRVLFRGDKMIQFNRNPNGTFWRRPMEYDLNQLSPEDVNVPMDDFERELYEYERNKVLNSKGRNK